MAGLTSTWRAQHRYRSAPGTRPTKCAPRADSSTAGRWPILGRHRIQMAGSAPSALAHVTDKDASHVVIRPRGVSETLRALWGRERPCESLLRAPESALHVQRAVWAIPVFSASSEAQRSKGAPGHAAAESSFPQRQHAYVSPELVVSARLSLLAVRALASGAAGRAVDGRVPGAKCLRNVRPAARGGCPGPRRASAARPTSCTRLQGSSPTRSSAESTPGQRRQGVVGESAVDSAVARSDRRPGEQRGAHSAALERSTGRQLGCALGQSDGPAVTTAPACSSGVSTTSASAAQARRA